jgi:hypothetical protein
MGIALFYVTFLRVFFRREFEVGFSGFAGVFEGCFRKRMGFGVVFCGEFVVDCVTDLVVEQPYLWGRKIRQVLQLYFWLPAPLGPRRLMLITSPGFGFYSEQKARGGHPFVCRGVPMYSQNFQADRTWKGPLYADLICRTYLFNDGGSPASCR